MEKCIFSDLKKMSDQPVSEVYEKIGTYTNCNNAMTYNFDEDITQTFHNRFFVNHSCVLPFWGGMKHSVKYKHSLCTGNKSVLYNDAWANAEFRKTIDSMTVKPCTLTKVGFGQVHKIKTNTGNAQLTIKLPRQLEL